MKTSLKFLSVLAVSFAAFACTHTSTDDMLGNFKGMSKGNLLWSKTSVGIADASIDSKEEKVLNVKKNDKGEFYVENKNGVDIILQNVTSMPEGITFTIPKQKVQGKGEDSAYKSELKGLMEYTLAGVKCDGCYDRKNNTLSLSFEGNLSAALDTVLISVPFNTSYTAFARIKEEGK